MLQSILKAPSGPAVEKPVSLTFCEMPVNVHCGYLDIWIFVMIFVYQAFFECPC